MHAQQQTARYQRRGKQQKPFGVCNLVFAAHYATRKRAKHNGYTEVKRTYNPSIVVVRRNNPLPVFHTNTVAKMPHQKLVDLFGKVAVRREIAPERHQRPTQTAPGGIVDKEAPIDISNVALLDPKTGAATRVGFKILDDGRKVRVAKKSGVQIDA